MRTKSQTAHGCPIPEEKDDSNLPAGKVVELVSGMDQDATTQYFLDLAKKVNADFILQSVC